MHTPEQTGFSRRSLLRLAAALPVVGGSALLEAKEPDPYIAPFNTLTDEEEIEIGKKVAASLDAKLPLLHIGILDQYVNNMVQKLAKVSKRPNMDYTAKIVNDTEINARTFFGGHIYVWRGLLEDVQNECELGCVLGHEVGHVVGHHLANYAVGQQKLREIWEVLKKNALLQNQVIQELIAKYGGPLGFLALMKYSREVEFQADMFGIYEATRCGWDPNGIVTLFQRWSTKEGQPGLMDTLKRTHPLSADRAAKARQEIGTMSLPGKMTTDSMSFKAMKLAMKVLPPPQKA